MLKDAFNSIQCFICYKTYKECREYVVKQHFVCYHFNINNLNDKEMEFKKIKSSAVKRRNFQTKISS